MESTSKLALLTKSQVIKSRRPYLRELIRTLAPFPCFAVWMGIADDGLPVALNTQDSHTPNVVVWDKRARQSLRILKVVSEYVFSCTKDGVEFVVLTAHPEDYGLLNEYGMGTNSKTSCIGIIPFSSEIANVVIDGLARWIHENHTSSKHPVIILIDGLENLKNTNQEFRNHFRFILDMGRKRHVFVIGTSSKNKFREVQDWLDGFQVEMYGRDVSDEFEYHVDDKNVVVFYTPKTELL